MKSRNNKIEIAIIAAYLTLSLTACAYTADKRSLPRVELSTEKNFIKVGEPVIIKLTYRYKEPQISPRSNEVLDTIQHGAVVQIKNIDGTIKVPMYPIYPSYLYRQDSQGLSYSGYFVLFYDLLDKKNLLFEKPGTYLITLLGQELLGASAPDPLSVVVQVPSASEIQVLTLLSDSNDYSFLEFGRHEHPEKRPERVSHLKQVVEQCGDTLVAKWAAARLGLEYFEEFHKKHPSFEKFRVVHQQGQIKEPLFDQALMYLAEGTKLPDNFPIREEVIYQLSRTEFIEGNHKKALSLLDELNTKYPHGEYGKNASRGKAELQELIKKIELEKP